MKKILIETSARHLHVTQETLEILFGKGFQLEFKKELSQPGQFATNQKVRVVGPKGELNCTILGPVRKQNQVELSKSDARQIGLEAPLRESGDIKDSVGCKLVGPCGEVEILEGCIIAKRHIHMTEEDANDLNVKNGDIVSVKTVDSEGRSLIFGDTVIRVNNNFRLAMHIDTDESNAGFLSGTHYGEIVSIN